MRDFPTDIITELAKLEIRIFWLVELQMDTTYYFTNCDVDLVYGGNTYQSDQGLEISNISQGANFQVDKVTLKFGNAALWLSAILLNEDAVMDPAIINYIMYSAEVPVMAGGDTGEGGGVFEDGDVTFEDGDMVFEGGGEFYSMIAMPPKLFGGFITGYKIDEQICSIDLSTEFFMWRKKTLRLPTPSCPWSFKGTVECGYAGAGTWCDQSPERCKALSNYDNFGGRRWIASIEDKNLWWGDKGYERK
jgi:hypothetical protein